MEKIRRQTISLNFPVDFGIGFLHSLQQASNGLIKLDMGQFVNAIALT